MLERSAPDRQDGTGCVEIATDDARAGHGDFVEILEACVLRRGFDGEFRSARLGLRASRDGARFANDGDARCRELVFERRAAEKLGQGIRWRELAVDARGAEPLDVLLGEDDLNVTLAREGSQRARERLGFDVEVAPLKRRPATRIGLGNSGRQDQ